MNNTHNNNSNKNTQNPNKISVSQPKNKSTNLFHRKSPYLDNINMLIENSIKKIVYDKNKILEEEERESSFIVRPSTEEKKKEVIQKEKEKDMDKDKEKVSKNISKKNTVKVKVLDQQPQPSKRNTSMKLFQQHDDEDLKTQMFIMNKTKENEKLTQDLLDKNLLTAKSRNELIHIQNRLKESKVKGLHRQLTQELDKYSNIIKA